MFNKILAKSLPNWVTSSFPIIQTVLLILIALCAVSIILAILLQPAKAETGNNVITGQNFDSYYSKNKASTREGRLQKVIIWCISLLAVFTIIYFILVGIYNPTTVA